MILCFDSFSDSTHSLFLLLLFYLHFIFLSYFTLLLFYSSLSVLPHLMRLFNVISVITTSSNHTHLVDFNASLLESPFALMKAAVTCCQLAETLVSFLLLQQLSEDFYYFIHWFDATNFCEHKKKTNGVIFNGDTS